MSIKQRLSQRWDDWARRRATSKLATSKSQVSVLPVLHVEELDNDFHFDGLLKYLSAYRSITGRQALATVMTPLSPIVRDRIDRTSFPAIAYEERIRAVAEHAIVGLHGHFVRRVESGEIWPMHSTYYDAAHIADQLQRETLWLIERKLMNHTNMTYSGGWWFMNNYIENIISEIGYRWDFSLSVNHYNFNPVSFTHRDILHSGALLVRDISGHKILSSTAVCSIAKKGRPNLCFKSIVNSGYLDYISTNRKYLTFYSHDFDLKVDEAITATKHLKEAGFSFFEPNQDALADSL